MFLPAKAGYFILLSDLLTFFLFQKGVFGDFDVWILSAAICLCLFFYFRCSIHWLHLDLCSWHLFWYVFWYDFCSNFFEQNCQENKTALYNLHSDYQHGHIIEGKKLIILETTPKSEEIAHFYPMFLSNLRLL